MKLASVIGFGLAIVGLGASVPACSDPVAPVPDGAAYFNVAAGTNHHCPVVNVKGNVPVPPANKGQIVDLNGAVDKVQGSGATVDHCGDSSICCRVSGGGTYDIQATLTSAQGSVTFATTISDGQADAKGSVSVVTKETVSAFSSNSSMPCTFSIKPDPAQKDLTYGAAAGRAFGTFHCDAVSDPSNPDSACAVDGTFLVENCAQ